MAFDPKDIKVPKEQPAETRQRRPSPLIGFLMSFAVHLLVLWLMFPQARQEGFAGGAGFADEIEITSNRESSSGLEGDRGSTDAETAQERQSLYVSVVFAPPPPPPPPEPEEYLPEDEPEPEPEEVEEEPEEEPQEEVVEEDPLLTEEDQEEDPVETFTEEGDRAVLEQDAEVPTEIEGDGAGEDGLSETTAGSVHSDADEQGLGSGNADTGREGDFVPGGELESLLRGWTIVGTNGFADGSINTEGDNRAAIPWGVYYNPNGRLQARFRRWGAPQGQARGNYGFHWYNRSGRWTIEGDQLCQRVSNWGGGGVTCFEVHRDGDNIAMYYSYCRGVHRCWVGRLGPRGVIRQGNALREVN